MMCGCSYSGGPSLTLLGLQSRFGDNWEKITWNLSGLPPKRDWSSKGVKAVVSQNTMAALSRAAALLVSRAVTALLRAWKYLSKAVTASIREIPCFSVLYPAV